MDAQPLTPADFGNFEATIHQAFEKLFGTSWTQASEVDTGLCARSVRHPIVTEEEIKAYALQSEAVALREKMREFLLRDPPERPRRWPYLLRLAFELDPQAYYVNDPDSPSGTWLVIETSPESRYEASFERRRELLICRIAAQFPAYWPYLPTSTHGPHCPAPTHRLRSPNVMIRGVSAALVLGGWFTSADYPPAKTGAARFRGITKYVSELFNRLGKANEFQVGAEPPLDPIVGMGHDQSGNPFPIRGRLGVGLVCRIPGYRRGESHWVTQSE